RDHRSPEIAAYAVPEAVPELGVLREATRIGFHGTGTAENRIAGGEPAVAVHTDVREADVVVERSSHVQPGGAVARDPPRVGDRRRESHLEQRVAEDVIAGVGIGGDRKSTRLNSSHGSISYAVFCLK